MSRGFLIITKEKADTKLTIEMYNSKKYCLFPESNSFMKIVKFPYMLYETLLKFCFKMISLLQTVVKGID